MHVLHRFIAMLLFSNRSTNSILPILFAAGRLADIVLITATGQRPPDRLVAPAGASVQLADRSTFYRLKPVRRTRGAIVPLCFVLLLMAADDEISHELIKHVTTTAMSTTLLDDLVVVLLSDSGGDGSASEWPRLWQRLAFGCGGEPSVLRFGAGVGADDDVDVGAYLSYSHTLTQI